MQVAYACLPQRGSIRVANCIKRHIQLQKEGRKITHHSSRLGLIGWTGSIQIIKTIHHKMCNTNNVQLPHELLHGHNVCTKQSRISVPNRLQGRALKDKEIFYWGRGAPHAWHMHGAIWHLEPSAPPMMSACLLLQIAPKPLSELPGKACTWNDGLIITSA